MADKMECPGCEAHSSTVRASYASGEGCPFCGLSSSAMAEIFAIRRWRASKALEDALTTAIKARDQAEAENRKLKDKIERIWDVVNDV